MATYHYDRVYFCFGCQQFVGFFRVIHAEQFVPLVHFAVFCGVPRDLYFLEARIAHSEVLIKSCTKCHPLL